MLKITLCQISLNSTLPELFMKSQNPAVNQHIIVAADFSKDLYYVNYKVTK